MPLSLTEKSGIIKLLSFIPDAELISLAKTLSKNLIHINNAEGAKNAVVTFSESPAFLLRRRKVKREYLFKYLINEAVTSLSPMDSKQNLSVQALKLWNSAYTENDLMYNENDMDIIDEYQEISAIASNNYPTIVSNYHVITNNDNIVSSPNNNLTITNSNDVETFKNTTIPLNNEHSHVLVQNNNENNSNNSTIAFDQQMTFNIDMNFNIWTCWRQFSEIPGDLLFGTNFCNWFFKLLNEQAPIDTGPFFPDCCLQLIHTHDQLTAAQCQSFQDVDAGHVCARLNHIAVHERIRFNANLEPHRGMRCFSDRFGRRMVVVCGTLHRDGNAVGLFEQQFVILRDCVVGDSWKIKFVRLVTTTQLSLPPVLEATCKLN